MNLFMVSTLVAAVNAEIIAYGHRGSSGFFPENTMRAFEESVREGASVELDLQISADGRVVVIHDDSVDRTTDGTGRVNDLDWSYMAELDAGAWFDDEFAGEKLPLLEDVLEWYKALPRREDVKIMLDTKNVQPLIVPQIADILSDYRELKENLLMGCWNEDCLRQSYELIPELPVFVISSLAPPVTAFDDYKNLNVAGFHLNHNFIEDPMEVERIQESFDVHTWTVNTEEAIQKTIHFGVDAIYGDYPARIVAAIAGREVKKLAESDWRDTRESAIVGACRRLQKYGPFFAHNIAPLERFFMTEEVCVRTAVVCRSTRDESPACVASARVLTTTLDKFLEGN